MKQQTSRRLRFEALESRRVLSGTVLFIRGGAGTGGFLEGGSDEQLADITNFSQSGGNHGWGELANALTGEGFTLNQVIEGPGSGGNGSRVPLSSMNLDQYDVIVFGSNNAVYNTADVDAFEQYVRGGGSALFISDANFGSDWADAPNSDQQFLDRIGINVHQDQGTYVVGNQSGEILASTHPVFVGVGEFDGEGVSPFHIAETVTGVGITPLATASGNTRLNQSPFGNNNQGPSRQTNNGDYSSFAATWDLGRIVGHYDRNTFFNLNGAGTNINRFQNRQYAINIFQWLAAAPNLPGDYNSDCNVDIIDYAQWSTTFGSTTELAADGNRNGIIDAADFTVWQDNVGASCPAAATSVTANQHVVPFRMEVTSAISNKSPFTQSTKIELLNYDQKRSENFTPRGQEEWNWQD